MDKKGLDELAKVESPFTDETIYELMKIYLETGSVNAMYHTINSDPNELKGTTYREREILQNKLNSISDEDLANVNKNLSEYGMAHRKSEFYYYGSKGKDDYADRGQCIRIYLNLPAEQRAKFANEFMVKCSLAEIGQQFEYSNQVRRMDNTVIFSSEKYFSQTMDILKEMEEDYEFKEPCRMAGQYDGKNIGVASESVYGGEGSYNMDRLNNLPRTIVKLMEQNPDLQKEYIKENGVIPRLFSDLVNEGKRLMRKENVNAKKFSNLRNLPSQDELQAWLNDDIDNFNNASVNVREAGDVRPHETAFKNEKAAVKSFEETSKQLLSFLSSKVEKGEITQEQIANTYRDCLEFTGVSRDGLFTKEISEQVQERLEEHERLNELEQTWKYLQN